MTTTSHIPARLSVADWREQARIYATEMPTRPDLMLICLNQADVQAAEGERTLAEILLGGETSCAP
jgi:hypothetical protein